MGKHSRLDPRECGLCYHEAHEDGRCYHCGIFCEEIVPCTVNLGTESSDPLDI